MHFYESSIITTKDGLYCQVYGNEHPINSIIVKPKYIPTDKIESDGLQYRFISGRKMNRLNMWSEKSKLKEYLENFKTAYPKYICKNFNNADRLFFTIPIKDIERIYFPRRGVKQLMDMPKDSLDNHLKDVYDLVKLLLKSGLRVKDLGITYSTLMGHYNSKISDINIVVYGKENFWKLMDYLKTLKHPLLRWKTEEEWKQFHKRRNRFKIFEENKFVQIMKNKKSEGFFNGSLFVIFATEKEEEVWFKWGAEKYEALDLVTVDGEVINNFDSIVRPGCYDIQNSKIIDGTLDVNVKKIVFYSRDYCMIAYPGDKIRSCGILEKVTPKQGDVYYRVVVGYFDAYISDRREKEFIKVIYNE